MKEFIHDKQLLKRRKGEQACEEEKRKTKDHYCFFLTLRPLLFAMPIMLLRLQAYSHVFFVINHG
jgi:hypothetical protein